jgi:hypothetical protein
MEKFPRILTLLSLIAFPFGWAVSLTGSSSTLAPQGLLIKDARKNVVLRSANFETRWGLIGTITRTPAADTGLGLGLDLLVAVHKSGADAYWQDVTGLSTIGPNCISAYVKKPYGSTAITRIGLYDDTSSAFLGNISINWATGEVTALQSGTLLSKPAIGIEVVRVSMSVPAVTAGHNIRVYVYPDASPNQGSVYIGRVQVEAGAAPTPYIPTTTAPLPSNKPPHSRPPQ